MFYGKKIEKTYEKEEIFELYMNTIYFGNGYYNIGDASQGYFNKEPKQLKDEECIMLAGIPNAPAVYAPNVNPNLAKQRQEQVIAKMIKYGKLTKEEAERILNNE